MLIKPIRPLIRDTELVPLSIEELLMTGRMKSFTFDGGIASMPNDYVPNSPVNVTVKGITNTNILPDAVAGCETLTGWNGGYVEVLLDSANKYEGANCIKITLSAGRTVGYYYRDILSLLDMSKHYLLTAYVKNGNVDYGIRLEAEFVDGGITKNAGYITATNYTRVGIPIQPSDFINATQVRINLRIAGAENQYAFFDALMLNEITAEEYALGVNALMQKYSWHLGTKSTVSASRLKSVGKNLFDGKLEFGGLTLS